MRTIVAVAIVGVVALASSAASAACPGGKPGSCVNLDLVPQISRQIVATEPSAPPQNAARTEWHPAYTGPIVGLATNVRRAPVVGYRWSLE